MLAKMTSTYLLHFSLFFLQTFGLEIKQKKCNNFNGSLSTITTVYRFEIMLKRRKIPTQEKCLYERTCAVFSSLPKSI